MSKNTNSRTQIIVNPDPSPDDDIYIDCKPVEADDVSIKQAYSGDDSIINNEMLEDLTRKEFNIFKNPGFKSIIAVGIFAIILFSGNYVFNKLPSSRLQKAIDKEKFS
tara:strand:- start:3828 stop:4151 length:324 start_codon:yes stop_codon:yes gene_type:complete